MSENKDNKFVAFFNSLSEDVKKTFKDLITEVKEEKFEDTPASYTEVPLLDGTVIKVTKLEVGGEVIVVSPEGEIPAAEGELVLADNSILVIKKEGEKSLIAEIKPAEEMKKDEPKDTSAAKFEEIKQEFASIKAEFSKENKALKSEVESLKLKVAQKSAQLKKTVEVLEAFASVPTAEPIKKPTVKIDKKDEMFKTIFKK
jgi:hypothetical protein